MESLKKKMEDEDLFGCLIPLLFILALGLILAGLDGRSKEDVIENLRLERIQLVDEIEYLEKERDNWKRRATERE